MGVNVGRSVIMINLVYIIFSINMARGLSDRLGYILFYSPIYLKHRET